MSKYPGIRVGYLHGDADGFGKVYAGSSKSKQIQLKKKVINKKK